MSFTGIWEQYNPHILHWLIVRELVQLEIIRFRAVYLTALFFLLNQMLSLRIVNSINCIWVAVAGIFVPDFIYNIGTTVLNGGVSMVVFFFVNKVIFPETPKAAVE